MSHNGAADPGRISHATDDAIIATLLRQWPVALVLIGLTIASVVGIELSQPATYEASSTLRIASPNVDPAASREQLVEASDVLDSLDREMETDQVAIGTADVNTSLLDRATVRVESDALDPITAERAVETATSRLERLLAAAQTSASEVDRLAWRTLTPDATAVPTSDGGYRSTAVLWLDGPTGVDSNPFAVNQATVRVIHGAVTSDQGRRALNMRLSPATEWSLRVGSSRELPTFELRTSGPDAETVSLGLGILRIAVEDELEARQARAGVAPAQRILLDEIASSEARPTESGLRTLSMAVLIGGLTATIAAAAVLDVRRRARARRSIEAMQRAKIGQSHRSVRLDQRSEVPSHGSP